MSSVGSWIIGQRVIYPAAEAAVTMIFSRSCSNAPVGGWCSFVYVNDSMIKGLTKCCWVSGFQLWLPSLFFILGQKLSTWWLFRSLPVLLRSSPDSHLINQMTALRAGDVFWLWRLFPWPKTKQHCWTEQFVYWSLAWKAKHVQALWTKTAKILDQKWGWRRRDPWVAYYRFRRMSVRTPAWKWASREDGHI